MPLPSATWNYCLSLLSKKSYTENELRSKLTRRKVPSVVKDEVINRLTELNLINDTQYARRFIEARTRLKPRGLFLLKRELYHKGISQAIIENVLQDTVIDEYALAKKTIQKFHKRLSHLAPVKRKAKYSRILSSRGFNPEIIYEILRSEF